MPCNSGSAEGVIGVFADGASEYFDQLAQSDGALVDDVRCSAIPKFPTVLFPVSSTGHGFIRRFARAEVSLSLSLSLSPAVLITRNTGSTCLRVLGNIYHLSH